MIQVGIGALLTYCRDEIPETNHFNNYFKNRLKVEEAISNLKQQQNI